jgi:hypothetical protein
LAAADPETMTGPALLDAIVASEKALSHLAATQLRLLTAFAKPFTAGDPMPLTPSSDWSDNPSTAERSWQCRSKERPSTTSPVGNPIMPTAASLRFSCEASVTF